MPYSPLPVCGMLVLGAIAILPAAPPALAQLVPDATLGVESSTVTPNAPVQGNLVELIGGGAVQGDNLFHSFFEFNVDAGQRVYFANPAGVEAIFSRITGGNPSNIFGTLGVDGAADLFLMNPNGLVFGPGARLDVQGAFTATTASAIQFGEQGSFGVADPNPLPILTVAPSALWFNQLNQGSITSQGILGVEAGQNLVLAGGNLTLDGSILDVGSAVGGRIELAAVAGNGAVAFAPNGSLIFPETMGRADILIGNDSVLDVTANDGGSIALTGRNITISDSQLSAGIPPGLGTSQSQSGNIQIRATETIRIEDNSLVNNVIFTDAIGKLGDIEIEAGTLTAQRSQISNSTIGSGNAGNINIRVAENIVLDDANVFSLGGEDVAANGGNITIDTTNLSLINGAQISASTFGIGVPGNVVVNARDRVSLDGFPSAIFSSVFGRSQSPGGDIQITARELSLTNSAKLDTSVNGQGSGGNVVIDVQDGLIIDGIIQGRPGSAIFSTIEEEGTGTAGDVRVTAGFVALTNSGTIQSLTRGQGNAGNISIQARDFVLLDGFGIRGTTTVPGTGEPNFLIIPSSIQSIVTDDENASGNGGDIYVQAGNYISLSNTARIESSIDSETAIGNAGNITLESGSVLMDRGRINTTTFAQGNAGEIMINARDRIAANNSSRIQSSTFGAGNAGSIEILAIGEVSFDNDSTIFSTVERSGRGSAGNVFIDSASLSITRGSQFLAYTLGTGNAGNILISVADSAVFNGKSPGNFSSGIFAFAGEGSVGDGGDIQITARSLSLSEGQLTAVTSGNGNGGNILLNIQEETALDNETLVSTAVYTDARGDAGNIQVNTGTLTATNFGAFESDTDGFGNAGNITLNVRGDAQFSGAIIADNRIRSSGASSSVNRNGVGDAGTIRLTANSVSLTDLAALQTSTFGQGDGGDIVVEAAGRVFLDDARLVAIVGDGTGRSRIGNGDGGTIRIQAQDLSLVNGAQLQTSTFGNGDAGNIEIDAANTVSLEGEVLFQDDDFFRSAFFSTVGITGIGEGGDIAVRTGTLSVAEGAVISATTVGRGPAGNIQVEARDRITVDGYSTRSGFPSSLQSSTEFSLSGAGGNIDLSANQVQVLNGGQVLANSEGRSSAGTVRVNATDSILVSGSNPTFAAQAANRPSIARLFIPQSTISVRSSAAGAAGNLIIGDLGNTPRLVLDGGQLIAESAAVDGGNIVIDLSQVLLLRNGGLISTTAGTAQAGGNGGNITVRAPFIVAIPSENSDIRADAFAGAGGNVSVTARGIFGIEPRRDRSPLSDITATSELGVSGVIAVDTLDTSFIESGLTALEDTLVDTAALTSGSCIARTEPGLGSFTVTGGGGLPLSPGDGAISAYPTGTVRTVDEPTASVIREPDGVYQLPDGRLVLSRRCADRSAPSS
ncbi:MULTISPECIES: filamentous hemagglutinin N-terminal domain-containing protein [Cyanophyceae]|uniref:Filamentous hemagglutinin N-terminal domain-containing protein n=1 Tax=Leptolyngbya subtilissima DQ-A4 TaxID=2933933 RepID=A0ABV0KB64_9CYAN|nr:filamentous hemagglutinin N-terminal domain-containing protein [Nodosilinea sp. FACHB-141]MBD2110336.1 filamentous hemagglutinin N-terminal domain-containing protein [Nodosilinea sp. FACHB-141]